MKEEENEEYIEEKDNDNEEKEEDDKEKKDNYVKEMEMEEKRRYEENMQDRALGSTTPRSLSTNLLFLHLLLQGSFFQEEVKQSHCRDAQRPSLIHNLLENF